MGVILRLIAKYLGLFLIFAITEKDPRLEKILFTDGLEYYKYLKN